MMDLQFLGIGAAFNPAFGNTSACFQKDGTLYLLDCGSTVFGALLERKAMQGAKRIVVLITHLHADHVGSLGTLISYCHHIQPMPVTVVHPDTAIGQLLELNGIARGRYTLCSAIRYSDDWVEAAFYPVRHTQMLPAYGMLIAAGGEAVYYSGDAAEVPPDIWRRFLQGEIARLYQDCQLHAGENHPSHGSYVGFSKRCPPELRSRFFPIHWDVDERGAITRDGFGLAKPFEAADAERKRE